MSDADRHNHDHGHHAGHHHDPPSSRARLLLALALTLSFAGVEALAGWWSGSLALLSDAGHMVTDSFALALAALAAHLSGRPVSKRHSYGLRRVETLAGLVNGLLMLLVVGIIVSHAIGRLVAPQPVLGEAVMLVAAIGLVLNVLVAWIISRGHSDLNTRAALLHVIGDLLGSVAALASGVVIYFTDWYPIDPLLSMLICGLILAATLRLLRSATHTLLEGVPDGFSLPAIGQSIASIEGVVSVHDLHVWSIDSNTVALSAHVVLRRMDDWPGVLERIRTRLVTDYGIEHVTLQPELLPARILTFERGASRRMRDGR